LTGTGKKAFEELRSWNFEARASFIAPTIFREFWSELNRLAWDDERREDAPWRVRPASQVMADLIVSHPDSDYFDDKTTPGRETLADLVRAAFRSAVEGLEKRLGPFGEVWRWGKVKGTRIGHIASIPGFGRERLEADGVGHVINAIDSGWAPSWRMVVELGPGVRAWGTYPGGQSGNPGSRFYDDFVDDWAAGRPAELVFLGSADEANPAVVARTVMRGDK
jgi:penicillin amidase